MDFMNPEDSYANRRRLFKSIWETAMNIDEKDPDIMKKPKVIKTLKLDEVDRCVVGKNKKQRIKNLRTVCNKILDFCDKQDADDVFYEKLATDSQQRELKFHNVEVQVKNQKRGKKKIKKVRSMFAPITPTNPKSSSKDSKPVSPARSKKNTTLRPMNNNLKGKQQPSSTNVRRNTAGMSGDNVKRRKIHTKKPVKRGKSSHDNKPTPTGNVTLIRKTRAVYSPLSTANKMIRRKEKDKWLS